MKKKLISKAFSGVCLPFKSRFPRIAAIVFALSFFYAAAAQASVVGPKVEELSIPGRPSIVKLTFSGKILTKSFYLSNPDRLVVDVIGAVMMDKASATLVGSELVNQVKIAQNQINPDVVRIVFELKKPAKLETEILQEEGVIKVYVGGGAAGSQAVAKQAPFFPEIKTKKLSDRVEFTLNFPESVEFKQSETAWPPKFILDFSGYKVKNGEDEIVLNEGVVKLARVMDLKPGGDTAHLVIERELNTKVDVAKTDDGKTVIVSVRQPAVYGALVVIDPGHGGKDPGTMTEDGVREKDIVLDLGLKLRGLLEAAGARVIMTRDSDVFITLDDRAYIANRAGAELFVSIHINSLPNHGSKLSCRGPQMYFYSKNSEEFAKVMLGELSDITALPDRGMYSRSLAVLRKTSMKGVLAEVAFLSHPRDRELLLDDIFRQNAARGLFNGIEKFRGGQRLYAALGPGAAAPVYQVSTARPAVQQRGGGILNSDTEEDLIEVIDTVPQNDKNELVHRLPVAVSQRNKVADASCDVNTKGRPTGTAGVRKGNPNILDSTEKQ
ncbi:MAG TPA: N-acetylmuramoyl-L-alanine amidase [bacterium]|nr:N-acetylmuramoyl-L-alanine amidase [bacterium]